MRHESFDKAIDEFAIAMKQKMAAKASCGWRGWNSGDYRQAFQEALLRHVVDGDPVDVANYAMFLWNLNSPTYPKSDL